MSEKNKTNWYVITGGPSSGKTTTVNILRDRGYITTIEHARHYIDTKRVTGKTTGEIKSNQIAFQKGILDMQIEQEKELSKNEIVFLDRALPDARAYYQFLGIPEDKRLEDAIEDASYKKIFIMDPLPLEKDYARTENQEEQIKIHKLITKVYKALPFPVVPVPVLSPEERVDFILKKL